MKNPIYLSMYFVLIAMCTKAIGGPVGMTSLVNLEKGADLVILGSGRATSREGLNVLVEITAVRVLKGASVQPRQSVNAGWTAASDYHAQFSSSANVVGIWFLKLKEKGGWELLPVTNGNVTVYDQCIPVSGDLPPAGLAYEENATSQKKLISEIGAEIERSGDDNGRIPTILFLLGVSPKNFDGMADLLLRFSRSQSPRLKAIGLTWRIRSGDGEALTQLATDGSVLGESLKSGYLYSAISTFRSEDPHDIQTLGFLSSADSPKLIRKEAAYALRAIHTETAVPYLAQLLESDSDDLKYDGIVGLASFANNLPTLTPENVASMRWMKSESKGPYTTEQTSNHLPSRDLFNQQESKYLDFWKTWWVTNRASLVR